MNSTVTFEAGDVSVPLPNFGITDDSTALETNETYQLSFIRSTPSQDVRLGDPTEITITDDDSKYSQTVLWFLKFCLILFSDVTVSFNSYLYSFSEGEGLSSGISVVLSSPIAQTLSVTVFAGSEFNYIILSCFRGLCV